jgi:hypothetical protein
MDLFLGQRVLFGKAPTKLPAELERAGGTQQRLLRCVAIT